ncbi:hypothetical protein LO763_25380 [Glycomyces sp. A-F 0318]|uniref:hypothetical protein n=1 Tax=Glycomyces amatae TaxID=2881355 RepID=UPI001E4E8E6D|nr:hypothetical protein [Glycomyces amatae]MCD0446957.1 hypothetical protein [Glycomyces amatae]
MRRRGTKLLAWARPRRWSILGEAVLAAALALLAWPILAIQGNEPEAVDVVTAYLEALRDGDVERAETFVSDSSGLDADRSWLTAEAVSRDWEVESVELKSASDTTVHAVITAGGRRAEGAFRFEGRDDDLRIANPYVYLTGVEPIFAALEVNGVAGEVESPDGAPSPVALYPGSYALFASVPDLAGEDDLSLLALPGANGGAYSLDAIDFAAVVTGPLTGSEALETRLNEQLAAWLDDCAESPDLAPAGCPFSAAYDWGVAYDGRTEFASVTELDWTVAAHPKVRFGRDLRLETVEPGWMTLSGKGTALLEDGETALDGRCGVNLGGLVPVLGEDGDFTFTPPEGQGNTCY